MKISASIELFLGVDSELISVGTVSVAVEGFGYKVCTKVQFKQPIGFGVFDNLDLDDERSADLAVNLRGFKLPKIVAEPTNLEKELNIILKTIGRIVNHLSKRFGRLFEQSSTPNSEFLDRQLDLTLRREEVEKEARFRDLLALFMRSWRDAKEPAGNDFIPIYIERDETYLYKDKKFLVLLPRSFVIKLLPIEGARVLR